MAPNAFPYQAFWCEENIWHLAQRADVRTEAAFVLVLTGAEGEVACWQQRAGRAGGPVLWDYHVVLATHLAGWQVWDLDTRLGCPSPAPTWLAQTFPLADLVPARFQPRFAVLPAADYIARFGSDRSHMRAADGRWSQPPPPWPPIVGPRAGALTLVDAIDQARRGLDLAGLITRLGLADADS